MSRAVARLARRHAMGAAAADDDDCPRASVRVGAPVDSPDTHLRGADRESDRRDAEAQPHALAGGHARGADRQLERLRRRPRYRRVDRGRDAGLADEHVDQGPARRAVRDVSAVRHE